MTVPTIPHRAAADGLVAVDDRLRATLDAIPALVWLAGPDGAVVYAGRRWLEYTGLSAEQAVGRGWTTAVHPDDLTRLTEYCQAALETEVRLRRSDGRYRWFLLCISPVGDTSGGIAGWCGASIASDDRHRSTERQLRATLDNIPATIAIHSSSGELEFENRGALEFHGRSVDRGQQSQHDPVHPDDLPALITAYQRALM